MTGYRDRVGESFQFSMTGVGSGSIWGTGIYTDDSPLAVAAVHAGVLAAGESGVVSVAVLGPQTGFAGSEAHGITSLSFGAWAGSYRFESDPGGAADLVIRLEPMDGGGFRIILPPGKAFDIQYSTALKESGWSVIASDVTGQFEDTDAGRTGGQAGFYRGVLRP